MIALGKVPAEMADTFAIAEKEAPAVAKVLAILRAGYHSSAQG